MPDTASSPQKAHAEKIVAKLLELKKLVGAESGKDGAWAYGLPPALTQIDNSVDHLVRTTSETFDLPQPRA